MQIIQPANQTNCLPLRFISSGARTAAFNMAMDEALATTLSRQRSFSYLRFYRWQPYSLSFGYNQRIERSIDLESANRFKVDIVRRMSGGKMVFHADEHTFSLGLTAEYVREAIGNAATFLDMFKFAVEPLVAALVEQGVPARFSSAREMVSGKGNHLHCYAAAAGHSIFAGQHKLVGAAGVFRDDCLIIHGSIPISIVAPPAELFLSLHREERNVEMSSLSEFIAPKKIDAFPEFVARVYSERFQCEMSIDQPDKEELSLAMQLARDKYMHLNWPKQHSRDSDPGEQNFDCQKAKV